jgi:hypothetical protein
VLTGLALSLGNRCGHRPDAPRLFSEAFGRGVHYFVKLVLNRVAKVVYQQRLTRFFKVDWPELLAREPEERDDGEPVSKEDYQRRRSERLEAVCLVLGVLLRHLDFHTSRVIVDAGVDRGLTEEDVAKEAGISLRRAQRAMRTLRIAGIISYTEQRRQRVKGCGECRRTLDHCKCAAPSPCELWVSDAAIRKITPRLFAKLGADVASAYKKLRQRLNLRQPKLPAPGKPVDLRVPSAAARKRALFPGASAPVARSPAAPSPAAVHEIIKALMDKGMTADAAFAAARTMRRQE